MYSRTKTSLTLLLVLPKLFEVIEGFSFCFSDEKNGDGDSFVSFFQGETFKKTGLGSSACVIVSVVSVLLRRFLSLNENDMKALVEFASQIANSLAQAKIGSGFDVASAVYGNILFQRRSPKGISLFLEEERKNWPKGKEEALELVRSFSESSEYKAVQMDLRDYDLTLLSLQRDTDTRKSVGSLSSAFAKKPDLSKIVLGNFRVFFTWKKQKNDSMTLQRKPSKSLQRHSHLQKNAREVAWSIGNSRSLSVLRLESELRSSQTSFQF